MKLGEKLGNILFNTIDVDSTSIDVINAVLVTEVSDFVWQRDLRDNNPIFNDSYGFPSLFTGRRFRWT